MAPPPVVDKKAERLQARRAAAKAAADELRVSLNPHAATFNEVSRYVNLLCMVYQVACFLTNNFVCGVAAPISCLSASARSLSSSLQYMCNTS